MQIKAIGFNILVKVIRESLEEETKSGLIYLKNPNDEMFAKGEVISVGDKVEENINVGDIVYFQKYAGIIVDEYSPLGIILTPDKIVAQECDDGK